jgi:hypothetical protein
VSDVVIPVEANTRYRIQAKINVSAAAVRLAAHYGYYVTPWQRYLLERLFPPPPPPLRHHPRPLPIDGNAYRARVRRRNQRTR